jgi:transcription antitermination factor NusG
MAEQFWAACQTVLGREHLVRADIEQMERGAFVPTLVRSWIRDGKLCATETTATPGYVFFRATDEDWGAVKNIDGVQRVLVNDGLAMVVSPHDMARMVLGHAIGAHNCIVAVPAVSTGRKRGNSRKPRPGKRIRMRNTTVR